MMKLTSDLLQLKVLVDGKPIQEYHKDNNTFVEGRRGSDFELLLKNFTHRRLLIHPSVDGISVMTGKEASKNDYSIGYILDPWQEMRVPGWRLNNEAVARFMFAGEGQSYAEKTGRGLNKGVIAAAVWEEKVDWYWYSCPPIVIANPGAIKPDSGGPTWISTTTVTCDTGECEANQFSGPTHCYHVESECSHSGEVKTSTEFGKPSTTRNRQRSGMRRERSKSVNNLGAAFGKEAAHRVRSEGFDVSCKEPAAVAVIYYDDLAGLRNRGIKISHKKKTSGLPDPFPKDQGCRPPHSWRR
jgi:hypothetical protein